MKKSVSSTYEEYRKQADKEYAQKQAKEAKLAATRAPKRTEFITKLTFSLAVIGGIAIIIAYIFLFGKATVDQRLGLMALAVFIWIYLYWQLRE